MNDEFIDNKIVIRPFLYAVIFVFLSHCFITGCGRKAFPIAPNSIVPEAPKKVESIIEGGDIKIVWTLSSLENVKSINIYRSKVPKERFCPTCPYTFEPVGSFPASEKIYREKAASGYNYAFKIEVVGKEGGLSTPKIVTLEIP